MGRTRWGVEEQGIDWDSEGAGRGQEGGCICSSCVTDILSPFRASICLPKITGAGLSRPGVSKLISYSELNSIHGAR